MRLKRAHYRSWKSLLVETAQAAQISGGRARANAVDKGGTLRDTVCAKRGDILSGDERGRDEGEKD